MLAEDIKPSRLERAKRKVYDLSQMLEGDRIGLIAFAGTSFVQCPLTLDYGAFKIFLDYLNPDLIPVPGTAIGDAIRTSIKSFNKQERTSKALILITDGEDHESKPLEAAEEAKKEGIRIFTIGVGQEGGAPIPMGDGSGGFKKDERGEMILSKLDETTLQKIAIETGGSYARSVTGDMDLNKIYKEDIRGTIEKKELRSTRKKRWEERFQWFVFAGIVLLGIEFFIRERK
jgi:Ca-activated chloride channel family protein